MKTSFDIYLNLQREFLVVPRGCPVPIGEAALNWRKKRRISRISDDIKTAVERDGFYRRSVNPIRVAD